ncbi:hypothetical protein KJ365_14395 [Glaciecola sp. XM2]|uniref:hypothetical protein n=1 Tax=Glaciecola sp. XM2 TaxID=1914931 RepID=UPI001BDE9E81|nr:hypothetical protein [Glaciecola sp. XM2]MBT1452079.1 hypothetical protein [Glaciecola sp. XM2]
MHIELQQMDESCCEKDCCCQIALVNVAAIIHMDVSKPNYLFNSGAFSFLRTLYFTYLSSPKQPPKPF